MKNIVFKTLTNLVITSVCLSSFAFAQTPEGEIVEDDPIAEVVGEEVTLKCHDADDKTGLASIVLMLPGSKYALGKPSNTLQVIPGRRMSFYRFNGFVANPNEIYSVKQEQILLSLHGPKSGAESGQYANVPKYVSYRDTVLDAEVTATPSSKDGKVSAVVKLEMNGNVDSKLLQCSSGNGK